MGRSGRPSNNVDIRVAVLFRGGSLQRLTGDSTEKLIAGAGMALDLYIARAVSFTPDAYYGFVKYPSAEVANKRSATLRSLVYHHDFKLHVAWRGDKVYFIKAVDFDG